MSAGRLSICKSCLEVWIQITDQGITAVIIIKVTFSYKEAYYCKKLPEGSFEKLICREIRNFGLTKLIFRKTRGTVWGRETEQVVGYSDHQSSVHNAQFHIRKCTVIKLSLMLTHMLNKTPERAMINHGAIKFLRIKFGRSWKREMDEKHRLF